MTYKIDPDGFVTLKSGARVAARFMGLVQGPVNSWHDLAMHDIAQARFDKVADDVTMKDIGLAVGHVIRDARFPH